MSEIPWSLLKPKARFWFSWPNSRRLSIKNSYILFWLVHIAVIWENILWSLATDGILNTVFCFTILQEAIFDKNKGTVCLKTFNLYRKILTLSKGGNEQGEKAVSVVATVTDWQQMRGYPFDNIVCSFVLQLATLASVSILLPSCRSHKLPLSTEVFFKLGYWKHRVSHFNSG